MSLASIWRHGPSVIVLIVAAGGIYLAYDWSWQRGWDAREAEVVEDRRERQEQIFRLSDRLSESERERVALEQRLAAGSREIEDEVRADRDVCRSVSPDSVLRLERRWGVGPAD